MATIVLVRHGLTTANAAGVLAGWSADVHLNETGRAQAEALVSALHGVRPTAWLVSPLLRCQETAAPLSAAWNLPIRDDERVGECHYGAWTGRQLSDLAKEELWATVQHQPSAVTFPPSEDYRHESMAHMQSRAVAAVRELADEVDGGVGVVVSHGDVIKSIVADATGAHLDSFQRIMCSPASISVVRYTKERPYVLTMNHTGGSLADLMPKADASDAAVVGGGK